MKRMKSNQNINKKSSNQNENINTQICKMFDIDAENNLISDFERENNTLINIEKKVK